jgi:hypothetical protein
VRSLVVVGVTAVLAACGDARHEPVRVVAQPRAVAPAAPEPLPAAAPPAAPAPPVEASAPAPPAAATVAAPSPPRGLDAAPPPGLASAGPPQRRWQPGEPNGNADFRSALESRQRARGEPGQP